MGYWESVTPPDHTQSRGAALKKERRQEEKDSGRVAVLSCSSDHEEKEAEMWLWSGGERERHVFGAAVCFG